MNEMKITTPGRRAALALLLAVMIGSIVMAACSSPVADEPPPVTPRPTVTVIQSGDSEIIELSPGGAHQWPTILRFCIGSDLYSVTELKTYNDATTGAAGGSVSVVRQGCRGGRPTK